MKRLKMHLGVQIKDFDLPKDVHDEKRIFKVGLQEILIKNAITSLLGLISPGLESGLPAQTFFMKSG